MHPQFVERVPRHLRRQRLQVFRHFGGRFTG